VVGYWGRSILDIGVSRGGQTRGKKKQLSAEGATDGPTDGSIHPSIHPHKEECRMQTLTSYTVVSYCLQQ